MIEAARPQLAAMILLSLNCGYNNTDCSELLWSDIEDDGWLRRARHKTQVDRAAKLWPETAAALEKIPNRGERVFITKRGQPWVRPGDNAISKAFAKLAAETGAPISFGRLRHVCQTIAEERAGDMPAIRHVMGHVDTSISNTYRDRMLKRRVFKVNKAVRKWLYR